MIEHEHKHFSLIKYDSESEGSSSADDRKRSRDEDNNYNNMEYIIIFDDFSIELKDKSVGYFLTSSTFSSGKF